jgi:transcriptional regulator with XRE-family HTH domain
MFSEKLKTLRIEKHLSQEKLAEELNVSRQTISKWESGICLPDTEKLLDLCQYFGCTSDSLLFDEETTKNTEITQNTSNKRKKISWIHILLLVELISAVVILYCSQFIPSQKEYTQQIQVTNEYTQETTTETLTDTLLNTKGLLPFLTTYHLRIVFTVLCIDIVINLIILIKQWCKHPTGNIHSLKNNSRF